METFDDVREMLKELAESQKETNKQMSETDRKLRRLEGLFGSQWGKLVEALVGPGCLKVFKERGIDINRSYRNIEVERDGRNLELDVMLQNGSEAVIIEVKSTMKVEYIHEFLEQLSDIHDFFPELEGKKVYGAVGALTYDEDSDKFAFRKGLFVIKVENENLVRIANGDHFQPKVW